MSRLCAAPRRTPLRVLLTEQCALAAYGNAVAVFSRAHGRYYEWMTIEERVALEGEVIRKCLARSDNQVGRALALRCTRHDNAPRTLRCLRARCGLLRP